MPSLGTTEHRDPGERRADIVISDCHGQSSSSNFLDIVLLAYVKAGFKVAYNWPYYGGRVSEVYGRPSENHHVIQVELNRSLYMNETTKQLIPDLAEKTSANDIKINLAADEKHFIHFAGKTSSLRARRMSKMYCQKKEHENAATTKNASLVFANTRQYDKGHSQRIKSHLHS